MDCSALVIEWEEVPKNSYNYGYENCCKVTKEARNTHKDVQYRCSTIHSDTDTYTGVLDKNGCKMRRGLR